MSDNNPSSLKEMKVSLRMSLGLVNKTLATGHVALDAITEALGASKEATEAVIDKYNY